jgi:predicted Zn-dependent protease
MNRSDDALRYVREYIEGPPARPAWDRAATWDFIGTRALAHQRWAVAGEAYEHAVQAARNPRLIAEWGMSDLMSGRMARAESLFRSAVTLSPGFTMGWNGLAAAASWNGDTAACAESERNLARLDPRNPRLAELREFLARARAGK